MLGEWGKALYMTVEFELVMQDLTCKAYGQAWMESGSNGLELGEKDGWQAAVHGPPGQQETA